MALVIGHVEEKTPLALPVLQALRRGIVRRHVAQRGEDGREVGHRAAGNEDAACVVRIADEVRNPAQDLTLDLRRRRPEFPCPRVRVHRRRQRLGEDADHRS